jgi:outer membrane protein OmpA-like peptidoglycan-associated protein/opacity protein-like surface antigen
MRRIPFALLRNVLHALPILLLLGSVASAQITPKSVALLGEFGPGLYIGEFNSLDQENAFSPNSGYDAGFGLKYNIASNFSFVALLGISGVNYEVNEFVRRKYSDNFFGPLDGTTYPGSDIEITEENHIRLNKYLIMGQSHFNPGSSFVPYFTLGIGYITFSVTNDLAEDIPTSFTGDYARGAVVMPIGFGAQYFLNDRFSMQAQALFYINSTDYLDGYAHYTDFETGGGGSPGPGSSATPSDYLASLMIGASFTIYQPEPEPEVPEPLASDDVPDRPMSQPQPPADPPPNEPDTDGDLLTDRSEVDRYMTDPTDPDTDGDNLSDADEVRRYNTSPNNPDTDADGLSDGAEALVYNSNPLDADSDNDLLADGAEVRQYRTNPAVADTDSDMLGDGVEVTRVLTDPLNPDTDGDGVIDGLDDCPKVPGQALYRGCPDGTPAATTARPIADGPLSGLPEFIVENDRVDFEGIYFQVNTDDFDFSRPETARNLKTLLDYIQQCDNLGVVVEGHTSAEGNANFNQTLSEKRARRVRNWLLSNGVSNRKILGTIGYGGRLPRVEEPSPRTASRATLEQIRRQNRRITALVRRPCE